MTRHTLKTPDPYFSALADGEKKFDIRRNDRAFQTGDTLHLVAWAEPGSFSWLLPSVFDLEDCATHNCVTADVSFIFSGDPHLRDSGGMLPGYVVMSLENVIVNLLNRPGGEMYRP